jgi:outer membrane protein TolC
MNRKFTFAFMLYLAAVCQAAAQTLSIDSCYALALNNFPMIKQYELIEKSREYTLSNAGKAYLPQVSLTAIGGYVIGGLPTGEAENSSDVKFIGLAQINQTIWDGGATKTQKEIIAASAESEKASVEVALYELRSRVNQLYFGILMTDEQLAQLAQRETVLNNNADRIRKMNENGFSYKTDLDEIRVEQLKLNQQKTELKYVKEGYMQMLSMLAGIQIKGQTQLEKPELSDLLLDSEISRPELSRYESQRNLVDARAGMQRVSNMPKIGLLGAGVLIEPGVSFGPGSLSSLGVVGLSASWNISGLYKNANEKNLNQVELAKINLQEETFLFNTNLQTIQARANIEKQEAILAEDQEIVKLSQSIREGYQLKYDNGMSSLLDLLDASEKESEAKIQKALHEMQLLMTLYEYKTMTGN